MTATEDLRRMLDERGVEYEGSDRSVRWRDRNGVMMQAFPLADGELGLDVWSCTPEQAVKATLGRETCKLILHGYLADQPSIGCWSCDECSFGWHHSIYDKQFSYCPNCGRKVVDA